MKKLKVILLANIFGAALCTFFLLGGRGEPDVATFFPKEVDEEVLKKELSAYTAEELQEMLSAGNEILEWQAILGKTGSHIVDKVLQGERVFWEVDHYPFEDTFDAETSAQYYYHAHRKGEHGHFHLFLWPEGMEKETVPLLPGEGNYAHLIAISMNKSGEPVALFTTNRWVTGGGWYRSADVKKMVARFDVGHAHPSYVVNRWLKAMLTLFRPQIESLLEEREKVIMNAAHPLSLKEVLEDHSLEVISERAISIETQIEFITLSLGH